jgi:hypothetical protein
MDVYIAGRHGVSLRKMVEFSGLVETHLEEEEGYTSR